MKNNKKGFTLMELVVVIAIIAVLGLLLYPQVNKYLENANKTVAKANARTAYTTALFISATETDKFVGTDKADALKGEIQNYFSDSEGVVINSASCEKVGECTVSVSTNKGEAIVFPSGE